MHTRSSFVSTLGAIACLSACTTTEPNTEEREAVTWHQGVNALVAERCEGCHLQGGIAPFSLETYESAKPFAEIMAMRAEARTMPPFHAEETDECTPPLPWKDDIRLSDAQIQMLRDWADAGAPEGNPETAFPLPQPPVLGLETTDQTLEIPVAIELDGTEDRYVCFGIDPGVDEDSFIEALQVNAGNDAIVHHVLVYEDPTGASVDLGDDDGVYDCFGGSGVDGRLLGAWAPGATPNRYPENTGLYVAAGSRVVIQIHYHPTGAGLEVDDATSVDIDWYEGQPERVGFMQLIGNFEPLAPPFLIPAGATDHREEMLYVAPDGLEARLFGVGNHMHFAGTDMLMEARRDGEADQCLIQTPRWDFNWQRIYRYDAEFEELPRVDGGDQVYIRCTYDNSLENPDVVEALQSQGLDTPQDVVLGESTLDEMCIGIFGLVIPFADFDGSPLKG